MRFRIAFACSIAAASLVAAPVLSQEAAPGAAPEHGPAQGAVAEGGKPADTITRQRIEAFAKTLPTSDREDFDLVQRGFIATVADGKLRGPDGQAVGDVNTDAFFGQSAPATVNPSLWRNAQLLQKHGLFKVSERIYQIRGFSISNMTVIVGDTGYIIVDPGYEAEAFTGMQLVYEHLGQKPIVGVIYTHSHTDHYSGVRAVISDEEVAARHVPVVAPEGFIKEILSEAVIAGPAMTLCGVSQPALAQEAQADSGGLGGEIVVTAQKREQKLQDVGIAITAYSGEQLRTLNVTDSRDLAAFSPGVHTGGNIAGQNTQFTIRGVTQNDFNDIVEAPNAVYLDEGYIAVAQGQTFATFDIDRVEVLKGPQGTLFGRNATGGLVHFVTTKPSLTETTGYVDVKGGIYDSVGSPMMFHGEAALNVPLSTTLAVRGAVMWNKSDALLRNRYPSGAVGGSPGAGAGANLGDDDTLAGRLTVLFEPTDTARFTLSGNAARSRMSTAPYQSKSTIGVFNADGELVDVRNAAADETRATIGANGQDMGSDTDNNGVFGDSYGRPVAGGDFFGYIDPDGKDFATSSDFAFKDHNHVKTQGLNLTAEFDLSDAVSLTSVSDYKHFEKLLFVDVDAGPGNQAANYAGVNANTYSQELRLNGSTDSLNWVAGGFYLHIDNHSLNGLKFPVGSVVPGAPMDLGVDARLKTDSYSAFGQVEWKFAPKLTMILGGRVIREQKDYAFFQGIWNTPDSRKVHTGTASRRMIRIPRA
ncbi:TonB-dependent receptor domain-containing protein [Novosphingobium resinovorum]|uniref:TonB-dependent receptor domain-containing protein n=1 Tax=Novosphingobium resinovorum TaxID=158500 RepID=UPI002ED61B47|nr:TonB-dependent receptor [Novosphingobium resinovorum]